MRLGCIYTQFTSFVKYLSSTRVCMMSVVKSNQVNFIRIALNHSSSLRWVSEPYDNGPCDDDTPLDLAPLMTQNDTINNPAYP